jgi:hypothetical protein
MSCLAFFLSFPCHDLSFHAIPCHSLHCLTFPCHAMPFHPMPYLSMSLCVIPFIALPFHAMPCLALTLLALTFHAFPCHALPFHVMSCCWCNYMHNILPNINYQLGFVISRVDALYALITDRFLCLFSID